MKRTIIIGITIVSILFSPAQTVVKMKMPAQANEPLKVVVLFEEPVPEGMPVVLGLMGYNITGGMSPYSYQWLQNGSLVGTGDVVIITPKKGDKFELKATDRNRCYSTQSFSLKVIARIGSKDDENNSQYKIYPTLVKNDIINISLPEKEMLTQARIRIFDTGGAMKYQTTITGSSTVMCHLPEGNYFVSVQTDEFHKVEKIIVQQ
jgi:hypothetical protein